MQKASRANKVYFSALVIISTLMLVSLSIPQVAAFKGIFSEGFETSDQIIGSLTNTTGVGTGTVSLPIQDIKLVSSTSPAASGDILVNGNIAYAVGLEEFYVYDISNYSDVELVTSMTFSDQFSSTTGSLAFENDILYIPTIDQHLDIVNVTDYENPEMILQFDPRPNAYDHIRDVYVEDNIAFIAADEEGLQIWNVTDPANPTSIANYTDQIVSAWSVTIHGNYSFIGEGNGFHVVNLTDIYNPTFVARVSPATGGGARVQYLGNDLVASRWGIFDVSNVSDPTLVYNKAHPAYGCYIQGDLLISKAHSYLEFHDISDINDAHALYRFDDDTYRRGLYVEGDYLLTLDWASDCLQAYRFREDGEFYWDSYESFAVVESDVVYSSDSDEHIYRATISVNETVPTNTDITYFVTATNGTWWTEFTPNAETSFGSAHGRYLRWRAELSTTDESVTPTLSNFSISYTYLLQAPVPVGPEDLEVLDDNTPQFEWGAISGAENYLLQIDTSFDFDSSDLINITTNDDSTTYTLEDPLTDGQWYWRVASIDSEGDVSGYSQFISFTIDTDAGTDTGTTTNGFDLELILPYLIVGGAVVGVIAIVIVIRKRGK